jgi:hypothetical protein
MQEPTTEVVRAQRFEMVDEKGRVRAVLGLLGSGEDDVYGLRVQDEHGRARVWVAHDGPCAEVGLDHDGNTVAALTVAYDGSAAVFIEEVEPPAT